MAKAHWKLIFDFQVFVCGKLTAQQTRIQSYVMHAEISNLNSYPKRMNREWSDWTADTFDIWTRCGAHTQYIIEIQIRERRPNDECSFVLWHSSTYALRLPERAALHLADGLMVDAPAVIVALCFVAQYALIIFLYWCEINGGMWVHSAKFY